VWAQRSGSITSDSGTDVTLRGFKCMSPPTGLQSNDSSRHSRLQSRDSGKYFSGMIPDHLKSALEAVVAMSLPHQETSTEAASAKSSPRLRARGAFSLSTAWTDEPDQSYQSSNIGRDEGCCSQLSGKSGLLSPVAEHKHSLTEKKAPSRVEDLHIDDSDSLTSQPLRFLIVDDSAMNRRMLRRLLSAFNYFILEATDGKDCLRVWTESTSAGHAIDVVLVDNIMPIMSGQRCQVRHRKRQDEI
jgi:PleD family two-component response regulator